jgi:hypothetical protein
MKVRNLMKSYKEYKLKEDVMSRSAFVSHNKISHGEYHPKNFDRYSFKPDEKKVQDYLSKMRNSILNDVLIGSEALAGFYNNDQIVKLLDNYLTELSNLGIKI